MADQVVTLRITTDAKGLVTGVNDARKEIAGLGPAGQAAGSQAAQGLRQVSDSAKTLHSGVLNARGAVLSLAASLVSIQGGRALVQLADQYANITGQLRLVTDGHVALGRAQAEVFEIAQRTRTALEPTANLFARITRATAEFGVEQGRILRLTETINQAFVVSNASATDQANAITQLSQAFAGGILRAEEFNSVLDAGPRLAQALADGMGVSMGRLRQEVNEGTVTVERMVAALESQAGKVSAEFAQMAGTVEQAWTTASNDVLKWVGESEIAKASASALAGTIGGLGKNIDVLGVAVLTVASGFAVKYVAGLVASTAASVALTQQTARLALAELNEARSAEAAAAAQVAKLAAMRASGLAVTQLTAAEAALAAAQARTAAASAASATASAANLTMLARASGAMKSLGAGLLALAGGPIGVTVLALGGIATAIYAGIKAEEERQRAWEKGMKESAAQVDSLLERVKALNAEQAKTGQIAIGQQAESMQTLADVTAEYVKRRSELATATEKLEEAESRLLDTYADAQLGLNDYTTGHGQAELAVYRARTEVHAAEKAVSALEAAGAKLSPTLRNAIPGLQGFADGAAKIAVAVTDGNVASAIGGIAAAIRGMRQAQASSAADAALEGTLASWAALVDEARKKIADHTKTTAEYRKELAATAIAQATAAGASEERIAAIRAQFAEGEKLIVQAGTLRTAARDQATEDKKAADAAKALSDAYADSARTLIELAGNTSELAAAEANYKITVMDAVAVANEQLAVGMKWVEVQEQLSATIADATSTLDEKTTSIQNQKSAAEQLIDDLVFERSTIAMSNTEREVAIALRRLDVGATTELAAKIRGLIETISDETEAKQLSEQRTQELARSWEDFTGSLADAVLDGSSGVKRWWKQMIDDMKRQLIQSGLLKIFGSIFNIGGAQAGSGFGSMFASMFGGGRGMIGSAASGGSGLGIGSLVGSGGNLFSGLATAISGGVSSGLMGLGGTLAGLGMGGLGGGLAWAGGSVAANGLFGGLGGSFMTGMGNLFGAGGGALMGIGQMIPAIAAIAGVAMAIQKISGGKLFGTSYGFDSAGRTLDFSATGASGQDRVTEVRQRSLFRGRRWRDTFSDLPGDVADSIGEFWDAVTASNIAIAGDAARTIGAQIKQEFDKDGKVTSTIVEVIGRQYRESMEDAMTRIAAENMIANIDAMLGNAAASYGPGPGLGGGGGGGGRGPDRGGFDAVMEGIGYTIAKTTQTVGEAFAIAERWRSDANLLAEGAQFLLLAATDIKAGAGLLGEGGTLTQIADLIEELQAGSETLSETYTRVATSAAMLDQALALSGVQIDGTREHIVRFATSITDAAGGLETATALWNSYFANFYTAGELAAYQAQQLQQAAQAAFAGAGLDLSQYIDAGGMERFRAEFEAAMPTMSAEDIAAWLRAADALAAVTAAARAIDADIAVGAWQQYLDGLTDSQRAIAETTRYYDDWIASATAAGATAEQLAAIEEQRAVAMGRLLEAQEAARQADIDAILQPLQDDVAHMYRELDERGMYAFARDQARIARETQEAVAEAMRAGASAADILRINMTGAERAMAAAALAAADFAAELGEWEFEDYLAGLSDADAQRARLDRQWEQRYQRAIEIFGEGSAEAIRVLALWESAIGRVASAAASASDAMAAAANRWVSMSEIFDAITAFADKIDERIGHLKGGDAMATWLAEISGLPRKAQEAVRKPLSEVVSLIQAEYLDKATDLRDQLMRAMQRQAELPWNAQSEFHGLEGRIKVLQAALGSITGTMGNAMTELQSMYLASLQGVRDYLDSMLLDPSITTLTPAEQLAEALSQFNAAVAAGDGSGATSMAQTYLQLLRQYEASGQDYNDGFWMIRDALEGMLDADIGGLLDPGVQAQLDALGDLEALLREIAANTGGGNGPHQPPTPPTPPTLPPWHPWDDEQYFPNWPQYAAGGWVNGPTTLLAGEAGRELILPNPVSEFFQRAGIPVNVGGGGDTRALEARLDAVIARLDRLDKTTAQGAQAVSQTIVTTGATSDRNNDQSRARHAQAQRRGVTA